MKLQPPPVLSPDDPTLHIYAMLDGKVHLVSAVGDFSFEPEQANAVADQIKAAGHAARHIKRVHAQIPGDLDRAGKAEWLKKVLEDASDPGDGSAPKSNQPQIDVREFVAQLDGKPHFTQTQVKGDWDIDEGEF